MLWLTLSKAKKRKRRKENIVNAQKSKFKDWILTKNTRLQIFLHYWISHFALDTKQSLCKPPANPNMQRKYRFCKQQ